MNDDVASERPVRKQLDHSVHFHGRFGATYFITIRCQRRGLNQLCKPDVARELFNTAQQYHTSEKWYLDILLLMPDHLHMLMGINGDSSLSKLVRDFKRIAARKCKLNGSETSSITDCDTMKAKPKSTNIFAKIRCGLD
jgi:REP element-mobilizing transposase RayT